MVIGTSTRRPSLLTALAALLGMAGGAAAWVLIHLIELLTNAALFHELSTEGRSLTELDRDGNTWPVEPLVIADGSSLHDVAADLAAAHGDDLQSHHAVVGRGPHARTELTVPLMGAVGEVRPRDVHAGTYKSLDLLQG